MTTQILLIFLTLLFAGSHQQPVESTSIQTVSYCELVSNPKLYVGKTVRIKATYEWGFEWQFLYNRECMNRENRAWVEFVDEDDLCSGSKKKLKKLKDKGFTNKADVVVIGKLSGEETGHRYGDGGYGYQFVITCVESAKQISANAP